MQLSALVSGAAEGLRANQEQLIAVDGAASARATGGRAAMDRRHHGHSITLTPGTVTVSVDDKPMLLHCLTKDGEDDLLEGDMERHVKRLNCSSPRERDLADSSTPASGLY